MLCAVYSASSIGCFVCHSKDRDNPGCEDTFHYSSSATHTQYQEPCMATRKGRSVKNKLGLSCAKLRANLAWLSLVWYRLRLIPNYLNCPNCPKLS